MRARNLLGLVGGIGILSWPALSHACDPSMTNGEAIAMLTWAMSLMGILLTLLISFVSWLFARPRTRAKIYRVLGVLNVLAWVGMLGSFNRMLIHPEVWVFLSPSLLVGGGLWLVGSRGSRPRLGVTPGPV